MVTKQEKLKAKLDALAKELSSDLAQLESGQSAELLGSFVSDLCLAAADQRLRRERHQRQAECIAAAKARGVRFGRTRKPLPDNFHEVHRAWRSGAMKLSQAAAECGMTQSAFYSAAARQERTEHCAG